MQLNGTFFSSNEEYFDTTNIQLPGSSILDVFRSRLEGSSSKIDVSSIEFSRSSIYDSLFLIRGDIEFSSLAEPYFGSAINMAITPNINEKNTYLSFRRLVRDLIEKYKFDYILIDLGPSTGAITRLAFLASDKFLVPVTPDRFCYLGVKTLPAIIKSWFTHDKIAMAAMSPYGINETFQLPQFCGVINQNFQIHRNQIKNSYKKWANLIKKEIVNNFMHIDGMKVSDRINKTDPFISSIENIGQHAPVSQMLGKAVFDLDQADSAHASANQTQFYGNVYEAWEKKTKTYEESIKKIVEAIQ